MKKLRVRITGIIVLVLFISTALLFWFSWQWTKQSMSAQMEDDYSVVADKYSQELTAWVNARGNHYAGHRRSGYRHRDSAGRFQPDV